MLQFFKKPGQKDKNISTEGLQTKSTSLDKPKNKLSSWTEPIALSSLDEKEEEEICTKEIIDFCNFRSRLSKTLPQILADQNALGYFIQYMESKDCIALIKFWLEVECLCRASSDQQLSVIDKNQVDLNESLFTKENQLTNMSNGCTSDENVNKPKNRNYISDENSRNKDNQASNTRQDALRIYKKYIASNALGPNRIPTELKSDIEHDFTCQSVESMLKSLSAVQQIIYRVLEQEYVNSFLRSSFNCKHQIDILTSGNVQLADILYNETAFFYFIEFMEQDNKREFLDFWMSAINYKQNLLEHNSAMDPAEAQSDALIIYEKFFSLQATTPLGMSNNIRFQIEQNICREDGKSPQPDCFDKPCKIVYHYFVKYYLPNFLSSQLYYKYLSELISAIQNNMCSNIKPTLNRTDSDCSSEISTLSAPVSFTHKETERTKVKEITTCSGSMNIDTKQLYDPDSLWRRNKKSLSVGYIDNLGRFVTEMEPEPRRKRDYEFRISRAVKKWVHLEQDETKEELAWKIAEMIIEDIMSQTLKSPNVSS